MTTITLNDALINHFKMIADQQHTSTEQLISQALEEYVEDYFDILAAKEVLANIESGEERVVSWEEVKAELYEVGHRKSIYN